MKPIVIRGNSVFLSTKYIPLEHYNCISSGSNGIDDCWNHTNQTTIEMHQYGIAFRNNVQGPKFSVNYFKE